MDAPETLRRYDRSAMHLSAFSPLAFVALLAIFPPPLSRATPVSDQGRGVPRSIAPMPSQEQLLVARVTALERQVAGLQSAVNALRAHVHTYTGQRSPTTYMSIHDLANNMKPGSPIPTTDYYVPLVLSPGAQPGVGGLRATTSTPIVPPQ